MTPATGGPAGQIVLIDSAFTSLVTKVGPPEARVAIAPDRRFASLVTSIVSQLISVKAADVIADRVRVACGGTIEVGSVLGVPLEALRSAGLTRTKAGAINELATLVGRGSLDLRAHDSLDDAQVTRELTAVHGIGEWTAQVYLLTALARPDVWPVGDVGVRNGWSIVHDTVPAVSTSELRIAGEPFAGIRSTVAWYCWQALRLSRGDALRGGTTAPPA